MAIIEIQLTGDFDEILEATTNEVLTKSMSAELEGASDFANGDSRCAVRVLGCLSAITSGGSQAVFFKMNTFGEETFLEVIHPVIERYQR